MQGGIEGAIHSIKILFDDSKDDGNRLLLIDAQKAFISLNRKVALLNIRKLWPRCSIFLFNTYQGLAPPIVHGSGEILYSREGTAQGAPLAMLFYRVSLLPMIRQLKDNARQKQICYADDGAALGKVDNLRLWLIRLMKWGPHFGYYPERSKSILVITQEYKEEAENVFSSYGLKITTVNRYLRLFIEDADSRNEFISKQVDV